MPNTSTTKPIRILSLDGGGMRGLYSALVLHQMSEQFRKQRKDAPSQEAKLDIGKAFDIIVGTSTGGILACAIAFGIETERIIQFYREDGPKIFTDPMPEAKLKNLKFLSWLWRNKTKPSNDNSHLRSVLIKLFSDDTLESLYKKRKIALSIPAVNMNNETARVFKTPHDPEWPLDCNQTIVNVCLATSAAPIYLPSVELPAPHDPSTKEVYLDGGLWANNPILVGLIEGLYMSKEMQDIEIVSIGTCSEPSGLVLDAQDLSRGLVDWRVGTEILRLAMSAQTYGASCMADHLVEIFNRHNRRIKIFRVQESRVSKAQIELLKLDSASPKALDLFSTLGIKDGLAAYRCIHDSSNADGQLLRSVFESMPYLPKTDSENGR